jgi:hypothetical protein
MPGWPGPFYKSSCQDPEVAYDEVVLGNVATYSSRSVSSRVG